MSVNEPAVLRASLRLYVAGQTPGARRALDNRLRLIEELDGKVVIEIIDILIQPEEAEKAGILATPTLADEAATPPRRLVGDISDIRQVLEFFGFRKKDDGS
jgi:circadian clock protein KaiB